MIFAGRVSPLLLSFLALALAPSARATKRDHPVNPDNPEILFQEAAEFWDRIDGINRIQGKCAPQPKREIRVTTKRTEDTEEGCGLIATDTADDSDSAEGAGVNLRPSAKSAVPDAAICAI